MFAPDPCFLRNVPVVECRVEAQRFAEAADRVPERYWRLVTRIVINPGADGGRAWAETGTIQMGSEAPETLLWHECAHLVSRQNDDELLHAFADEFWTHDSKDREERPIRGKPWSRSGYDSPSEDFAESVRGYLRGDRKWRKTKRGKWLRAHVFAEGE